MMFPDYLDGAKVIEYTERAAMAKRLTLGQTRRSRRTSDMLPFVNMKGMTASMCFAGLAVGLRCGMQAGAYGACPWGLASENI